MMRRTVDRRSQRGMSSVGWIGVVAIFGLLVITFFKVFPMYYENFKVKNALKGLAQDATVDAKSKREIWESLQKRMFVDEVRSIKREDVKIERVDNKTTVTITYETRDDYIGNLFIGGRFTESVVIDR